jgi:sugar/nucleoside kinase (ribokinase family)
MGFCPECGAEHPPEVAACPRCRVVLSAVPPANAEEPEVVHRVGDAAAGALLSGMLVNHGIRAVLRSAMLPGYGTVRRDWATTAWGEIMVPRVEAAEARALIAEYLLALERGGQVQDEDVEEGGPS